MTEKMHNIVIWIMDRNEEKTKCSYGIGYPICNVRNEDLHNLKFVGDADDALYEVDVPEKIFKRMTR